MILDSPNVEFVCVCVWEGGWGGGGGGGVGAESCIDLSLAQALHS